MGWHLSLKTICLSELKASIHRPARAPLVKTVQKTKPVTASKFMESRESRFRTLATDVSLAVAPFRRSQRPLPPVHPQSSLLRVQLLQTVPNGGLARPGALALL